jgi:hypothetical protein
VGLIGDYIPFYVALPYAVSLLKPEAVIGFAVESRSTPWLALERMAAELKLELLSETVLTVPEAALVAQTYYFFVAKRLRIRTAKAQKKTPDGKKFPAGAFGEAGDLRRYISHPP